MCYRKLFVTKKSHSINLSYSQIRHLGTRKKNIFLQSFNFGLSVRLYGVLFNLYSSYGLKTYEELKFLNNDVLKTAAVFLCRTRDYYFHNDTKILRYLQTVNLRYKKNARQTLGLSLSQSVWVFPLSIVIRYSGPKYNIKIQLLTPFVYCD